MRKNDACADQPTGLARNQIIAHAHKYGGGAPCARRLFRLAPSASRYKSAYCTIHIQSDLAISEVHQPRPLSLARQISTFSSYNRNRQTMAENASPNPPAVDEPVSPPASKKAKLDATSTTTLTTDKSKTRKPKRKVLIFYPCSKIINTSPASQTHVHVSLAHD